MLKGGYKIINFKEKKLSSSPVVIKGIYESIEENTDKCLIASGIAYDGAVYNDEVIATPDLNGTDFVISFHNGQIIVTVNDDDEVTLSAASAPASASAKGVKGQVIVTDGYIYTCVATDTWQRVATATF